MTEERVKELAEDFFEGARDDDFFGVNDVEHLIRIVAAESGKEGIEEALKAVNTLKAINRDSGEHVVLDMATDAIERLREQG